MRLNPVLEDPADSNAGGLAGQCEVFRPREYRPGLDGDFLTR
jgi:hypothetical protein